MELKDCLLHVHNVLVGIVLVWLQFFEFGGLVTPILMGMFSLVFLNTLFIELEILVNPKNSEFGPCIQKL